jgi:nicotinate phosphoribosyltransferase
LFSNCTAKPLQVKIFENGKLVYNLPSLQEIKDYVKYQLDNEIWEEEQRFVNPHVHYMDMTPEYYNMKMNLLNEKR